MIKKLQKKIFWIVLLPPLAVFFVVLVIADVTDIFYLYNDVATFLTPHELHVYILKSIMISTSSLVVATVLLYFIAKYISHRITAPVEEAIAKQNRFVADASHELKTPVSVINANIAVLERNYGENKWMKYIKDEGHKMNLLINQLLNLSRLDYEVDIQEEDAIGNESFEVIDALTEAVLPFDSIAFEKHASIDLEFSEEYVASGIRDDFKEIISILLDNGIRHVNDGGIITASARGVHNDIIVSVANTGSTINPADLPHIFDRFYKGAGKDKSNGYSFGLGLSIAKALSDKNGYDISALSEKGETKFIIAIPVKSSRL